MQYSQETIDKLVAIVEKKGYFSAAADYLGIASNTLLTRRRQYPLLDEALKKGMSKYKKRHTIRDNHEFSKKELKEITQIVQENSIEIAAHKYKTSAGKLHEMRKTNKALDEAIKKGQQSRDASTDYANALNMFNAFTEDQLEEVKKIATGGGVKAVVARYNISLFILGKSRKELPKLEEAVKSGSALYMKHQQSADMKAERKKTKARNPYNKKDKHLPPPRELIDSTAKGVVDQSQDALVSFRKMVRERKEQELRRAVRSKSFADMFC